MTVPPTVVGRYHIERLIAHGGMGSVYLARDPAIDRQVVIKLLKEGFDDAGVRERFAREARSAGRLQHPNIVTVFDVGEHEERPFIAMEYVQGQTLLEFIRQRGVIRTWEKLAIVEEVCAGLHYAHTVGIVHRDIKPANVMRLESGTVKILDFGVARASAGPITRAGDVVGTLNYMSPEQLTGAPVDHRTDVYAVGALAYELVTHRMAFPGTIDTGVLHKILTSSHVPIEDLVPGIDPDIAAIVERAMARELDARYQNLEELRQDVAVVRTRLLETMDDVAEPLDPEAETRIDSGRIASSGQQRPPSRRSSTIGRAMPAASPQSSSSAAPHTATKSTVLLAVACAALAGALIATVLVNRPPASSPSPVSSPAPQSPSASDSAAAPPTTAPTTPTTPTTPPEATGRPPEAAAESKTPLDEQLRDARDVVRRHMVAGDRQRALDALVRGLALDANDPALNGLVADLVAAARRTATDARTAATTRLADVKSSAEFNSAESRVREAENLLRKGDRVGATRAFLGASALYSTSRNAPGKPAAPAAADVPLPPAPVPPPSNVNPPAPPPPPPVPAPARPTPAPEAAPAPRDPSPDARTSDHAAVLDAIRRYAQAYQSLNSADVARTMPSLTTEQLRRLDRDFSNYRRYGVEVRGERISVDGATATVTCEIVRSYETKNGVTGSNAVASVFHLRRSGSAWIIERLESRE
jgi:eukaryotic-like serine/threonine-protein kinase